MYPHERSLVDEMKDKPFAIVGINSDKDLAALKPRLADEKITWRSFWNGAEGTIGPIAKAWHVSGWPTVYVIDHTGVIRHKSHAGSAAPAMEAVLKECVAKAEAAVRAK